MWYVINKGVGLSNCVHNVEKALNKIQYKFSFWGIDLQISININDFNICMNVQTHRIYTKIPYFTIKY